MHEANQKVSLLMQDKIIIFTFTSSFKQYKKQNQNAQPKEVGVCGWLVASLDMVAMLVFIVYCNVCDTTCCCVPFKC